MEKHVTGVYQKIEDSVVGTYKKTEQAFIDRFLEEESDEDVKKEK